MRDIDGIKSSKRAHSGPTMILDESGDLGFSPNSSGKFVVAVTIVHETGDIARLAKRVRNRSRKRRWREELKFNNSEDPMRMFVLEGVAKMDCQIYWTSFDKDRIPMHLRDDKNLLYRMACEEVFREAIKRTPDRDIHVVIDKRYSKRGERDRSDQHLRSVIAENHAGNFIPMVRISQCDPFMSSELQVHDFIVGAIFQHLERKDDTYIRIIESKIVSGQRVRKMDGSP